MKCLICDATAFFLRRTATGWNIRKCGSCGLEFCMPMPTQQDFDAFYSAYEDPRADDAVVAANAERNIVFLKRHGLSAQSRLLDFGSGKAAFTKAGRSPSWIAYDPYKTGADDERVLEAGAYDWVTLWGVLEHVPDPAATLRDLARLLRAGGCMAITTVSVETGIPYQHKPPEHTTFWTERALRHVLGLAGMQTVDYVPYAMVQKSDVYLDAVLRTMPQHLRGMVHHSLPPLVEVPTNEVLVVATN